jgi:transposase
MQEPQHTCFAGVDVAKGTLVIAIEGTSAPAGVRTIDNQIKQIRAWLRTLPAGCVVAVEATGGYQDELVRLAHAQGRTVYVLNPRDVHHYAKACATRGKTDRVDAQLIASTLDALGQALKARGKGPIRALQRVRSQIDAELLQIMRSEPALRAGYERLQTITGIGPLTGAAIADLLTERNFANADAAVAFTGMDPRPHESGKSVGRRRLSKRGCPSLRRLLFLAAMAARRSKAFAPIYEKLRNRGLKTTEALVILARKILRIAFSLWNSGQTFNPALLNPACAQP